MSVLKRACIVLALLLLSATVLFAQDTTTTQLSDIYAGGVSYNVSGSPSLAGTGLYAHRVADSGTYAFTVVDAVPTSVKPVTVTTNFGVGVAQKVFTVGKIPIYIPTAAGASYTGTNTGWAWSTGAMGVIKLKDSGYFLAPSVRLLKSSVSNGDGYQPIVTVMFGWGK